MKGLSRCTNRRSWARLIGGLAAAGAVLLAGCSEPSSGTQGPDVWYGTDLGANPGKADSAGDASAAKDTTGASDAAAGDIEATVCVAPGKGECDSQGECGTGEYCDPCLRKCAAAREVCDPCNADVQCKNAVVDGQPGSACLTYPTGGSFCGRACLSAAGCPKGYSCEQLAGLPAKQCVPNTKTCAPGAGACKLDGDCPFTMVCSVDYGVCVKGCSADEACASGNVCSLGHCVPPCSGDGDCKVLASEAVCVEKKCKIPGGCLGSEECEAKESHCDPATHKCAPGCWTDADCKDFAKKCENTKCVTKGCTKNYECAYGTVCDIPSGQCKPFEGLYCAKCDPNDQEVKACGGKPNACFSFKDAQDQDKGSFCGIVCGSDPAGPCPSGWKCEELKDDKGASQGKFCLRPCYNTPVPPGGGTLP